MDYRDQIRASGDDPARLEQLYRSAEKPDQLESFRKAVLELHEESPDNVLLGAWYHRLIRPETPRQEATPDRHRPKWWPAVNMGLLTGLIFWAISDPDLLFLDHRPYAALLWSPVAAVFVMGFLVSASGSNFRCAALTGIGLAAACAYVFLVAPALLDSYREHYVDLMMLHIPLLAFFAVGITLVGLKNDPPNRFAFLIKSLEVFITAGLLGISGVIAIQITVEMFESLGVTFQDWMARLILSVGAGMVPALAVAAIYDPLRPPFEQNFSHGLSRLIATIVRILLILTFGVLVVYVFFIPFNFMGPFENREVLIIYNVMLFAIMALLVFVTPVTANDLSDQHQLYLRRGIVAVALLAALVSIYALAAILYRTVGGGITVNRLTVIGWNSINILLLILLIVRQARASQESWVAALHSVFSDAAYAYGAWGLFIVVAIPLLFP